MPPVTPGRRVLYYSDAPYEGGAERYLEYLIGELPQPWATLALIPDRRALNAWCDRLTTLGTRVDRAPAGALAALATLGRVVRKEKPDVVHLNLPHSYSAHYSIAAPVARSAGASAVVSTEHLTMISPMRLRGRLRALMTRSVDRIITLSESNRRDLISAHGLPGDPIRVVMNGVPDPTPIDAARRAEARARFGAGSGDVLLVMVGALEERKGHRFLFDALRRVRVESWRLGIVGTGAEEAALEAAARASGLGDRVVFAGYEPDVPPVLAAADVVVLPSSMEGMPLVLLEAMAVGRPVVATAVFGVPELFEGSEAAKLVAFGDADGLSNALTALIEDASLRDAMGRAARARYEDRHTAAHMAAATARVYEEVLA